MEEKFLTIPVRERQKREAAKKLPMPFFLKTENHGITRYYAIYNDSEYTVILKDKYEFRISHVKGILFDTDNVRRGELISFTQFSEFLSETESTIKNKIEESLLDFVK